MNLDDGLMMASATDMRAAVAIVTSGAGRTGRDVALGLARWSWPVVVVYLDDQSTAEATVAEITAEEGTSVAVRADLADDLDVQRLFSESSAAFGGVDVVAHTTDDGAALLYKHAARQVRPTGVIVSTTAERIPLGIARQLRERGITVGTARPKAVLAFLDGWRRRAGS